MASPKHGVQGTSLFLFLSRSSPSRSSPSRSSPPALLLPLFSSRSSLKRLFVSRVAVKLHIDEQVSSSSAPVVPEEVIEIDPNESFDLYDIGSPPHKRPGEEEEEEVEELGPMNKRGKVELTTTTNIDYDALSSLLSAFDSNEHTNNDNNNNTTTNNNDNNTLDVLSSADLTSLLQVVGETSS